MRVLWLCNTVLNDFAAEFQIKKRPLEGWIEGMMHELDNTYELEIGCCFPIIDECRMRNGICGGHRYYAYHAAMDKTEYSDDMKGEFKKILLDFSPDLVQIWGTELNHSRAMVEACGDLGWKKKVIVRVQGLMSACANVYTEGIPAKYISMKEDGFTSIEDDIKSFSVRGKNELSIWESVSCICERSDWGEFYIKQYAPDVKFERFDNVLRGQFYSEKRKWSPTKCKRHSIFMSQAHYPIKGVHFLLKAAGILRTKYPDISIRIGGINLIESQMGYGYIQYIKHLIVDNSLDDRVNYLGFLSADEIIEEYLAANVFVLPSLVENRSNSVCEAMMLGTPVVSSYVGGNVGVLNHGNDGYYYPTGDFFMLAGYIDRIFEDDELAVMLSGNAMKSARKRHDRTKICDEILKIYRKISEIS